MFYNPAVNAPNDNLLLAQQWFSRLQALQAGGPPAETALPTRWINAAAQLVSLALAAGYSIQIVVPDDETLPELSNALDIDLRPLCLILPEAGFATRIALRATLTLLKSRLARHAENNPEWDRQHALIARLAGLWSEALAWGARDDVGNEQDDWPAEIGHLFPARLVPASHAVALAAPADLQILIAPERYRSEWRDALAAADSRILCLSAAMRGAERRQLAPSDETTRQQLELEILGREVAELELELATAQGEIARFSEQYYSVVGGLMVELDTLNAKLALLQAKQKPEDPVLQEEAAQSQAQAERSRGEQQRFSDIPKHAETAFAPSGDLRKLYRQVAQKIHPDRAASEGEREWRTQLMSEANRAYREGDEAALREVLSTWQEGPEAGTQPAAKEGSSLSRQIARMRARLAGIQSELDRLLGSRLYELFVAARLARRQGRDLLKEMATNIELQIDGVRLRIAELEASAAVSTQPE